MSSQKSTKGFRNKGLTVTGMATTGNARKVNRPVQVNVNVQPKNTASSVRKSKKKQKAAGGGMGPLAMFAPAAIADIGKIGHNHGNSRDRQSGYVPVLQVVLPSTAAFTQLFASPINPMNPAMFPELALEAAGWEEVEFQVQFEFRPISGSQRSGAIYMYCDPDSNDNVVTSAQALLYEQNSSEGSLWSRSVCRMPASKVNPRKYLSPTATVGTGALARQNSFGNFYVFTDGVDTASLGAYAGWVWARYSVRFFNRKNPQPTSVAAGSGVGTFSVPATPALIPVGWSSQTGGTNAICSNLEHCYGFNVSETYGIKQTTVTNGSFTGYPLVAAQTASTSGYNGAPAPGTVYNAFACVPGNTYLIYQYSTCTSVSGTYSMTAVWTDPSGTNLPILASNVITYSSATTNGYNTKAVCPSGNPLLVFYYGASNVNTITYYNHGVSVINLANVEVSFEEKVRQALEGPKAIQDPGRVDVVPLTSVQGAIPSILAMDPNAYVTYTVPDEEAERRELKCEEPPSPTPSTTIIRKAEYVGHPSVHRGYLKGGASRNLCEDTPRSVKENGGNGIAPDRWNEACTLVASIPPPYVKAAPVLKPRFDEPCVPHPARFCEPEYIRVQEDLEPEDRAACFLWYERQFQSRLENRDPDTLGSLPLVSAESWVVTRFDSIVPVWRLTKGWDEFELGHWTVRDIPGWQFHLEDAGAGKVHFTVFHQCINVQDEERLWDQGYRRYRNTSIFVKRTPDLDIEVVRRILVDRDILVGSQYNPRDRHYGEVRVDLDTLKRDIALALPPGGAQPRFRESAYLEDDEHALTSLLDNL